MNDRRVAVFGAGGAIGEAIACAFADAGYRVIGAMRRRHPEVARRLAERGVAFAFADLTAPDQVARTLKDCALAVFAPILTLSAPAAALAREAGVARTLFFSSNNVAADAAAPVYRALAEAEVRVAAEAPSPVILRPTLLYGDPRLETIPRLVRMARASAILPLPGSGRALQQPLFHEDAARVALAFARDPAARGIFSVGGPDVVTMVELYRAVARAAGVKRWIQPVPAPLLQGAHWAAEKIGRRFPLEPAQIARADRNRVAPMHVAAATPLAQGLFRLVAAMDAQEKPPPQPV